MKYTEAMQMRKTADGGVINDALGNAITVGATMPLGGIGGLASLGGTIAGLAAGPAKEKDLNKMDKRPAYSYIPGVGAYRLARKQLAAVDNSRPRSTLLSEMAGPLTSSVAPALVGAGLGAAFGGQQGAAIGALAGGAASGGATLLGNLIGMARRRRTDMERGIEDEEESRLANLLVPGVAGYRTGRRALDAYDDEVKRNEWNEEARQYAGRELVADMLRAQGNSVYTFGGPGNDGPVLSYRPSSAPVPAEETVEKSGDKETSDESGKTSTTASKVDSEKYDDKEKPEADGAKEDKEQKKEAALRLTYSEALQLRKQAGIYQNNPNYDATTGILAALADFPNTTGRAAKSVAKPLLDMAQEYQFKRDMMQRDRFYNGLTAGIGVGGLTTAGAYGLTGLVPKLKDNKLLRWLLAGTAGGVAGVQAGRLSADAAAQRPQEVDV